MLSSTVLKPISELARMGVHKAFQYLAEKASQLYQPTESLPACEVPAPAIGDLQVVFQNVQGLSTSRDLLAAWLSSRRYHLIALAETWWDNVPRDFSQLA